jgi:small-conductance mechanosensitive channel
MVAVVCLAILSGFGGVAWSQSPAGSEPNGESRRYDEAQELLDQLDVSRSELEARVEAIGSDHGQEFELLKVEGLSITQDLYSLDKRLADTVGELDPEAADTKAIRAKFVDHLRYQLDFYLQVVRRAGARMRELRDLRESTAPRQLSQLESRITSEKELVDQVLRLGTDVIEILDQLGAERGREVLEFDHVLGARADELTGRLQLAAMDRDRISRRIRDADLSDSEELGDDRGRLRATEQRLASLVASLEITANLLAQRGQDVTRYRQLAITASGEVTKSLLEPRVLFGLLRDGIANFGQWVLEQGPTWIVRLVILFLTVVVVRLLARVLWFLLHLRWLRRHGSRLLSDVLGRLIVPVATVVGLILGLWFLGTDPTTLLTGVGVLGVIVGLALQDTLGNLAAGAFILIYRPYDLDDIVRAGGELGRVKAMGLANTVILTFDHRRLHVPNRKIWQDVIENRSSEPSRRVDLKFRVGHDEDLARAIALIQEILAEHPLVLEEPRPEVFVTEWADSWVELAVWPWAATEDWWTALKELPGVLQAGLAERGIELPYPRHDVQLHSAEPESRDPGE